MTSSLSRRAALQALAAVALGARRAHGAQPAGFFERHHLPIGLQLYTVGDALRKDLDGTLGRLAGIGYRALELAGFHGHSVAALKAAKLKHGVKFTSVHVGANARGPEPGLDGDIGRLAADLHELGATDVVLSLFPVPARLGAQQPGEDLPAWLRRVQPKLERSDWQRTAALLNERGAQLKREGLRFGFHNHNPEFAPVGGTTGLDILIAETTPETVVFQLDTGWAAAAGVDPVTLLRQHGRRFQLMHLKDVRTTTARNFTLQQQPAELGAGRLDWPRLLDAAHDAGVRKYYVEHEPPFVDGPFEMLARSYRFLSGVGVPQRSA